PLGTLLPAAPKQTSSGPASSGTRAASESCWRRSPVLCEPQPDRLAGDTTPPMEEPRRIARAPADPHARGIDAPLKADGARENIFPAQGETQGPLQTVGPPLRPCLMLLFFCQPQDTRAPG